MRFCGSFVRFENLARTENRPEPDGVPRERVRPALLAVDDADGRPHRQARVAQPLNSGQERPARGDHVLDQADAITGGVRTLDAIRGAVILCRLAHDQKRQPGGEGAAAASATAPSSGPASLTAAGSNSAIASAMRPPSAARM